MMERRLTQIENTAVDIMATITPWLAPIPSAWLIGRATMIHLGWHPLIAAVAAVAVECIGVVSIVLALRLHEWNQARRQSDPAAPVWLTLTAVAFYFIVTIGLTVVLDVIPDLARFAPAIFPLLAAVGAVNIAVKRGQNRREAAVRAEKAERKAARSARREPVRKRAVAGQIAATLPADYRLLTEQQKALVPGLSPGELQEMAGISASTARRWKRQVSANGVSKG